MNHPFIQNIFLLLNITGAKPMFKESKVNYTIAYGKIIRLKCELVNFTGVTVQWLRHGKVIVEKQKNRYRIRTDEKQSVLRIKETNKEDAGKYECRAQNKFGTASRKLNLTGTVTINL